MEIINGSKEACWIQEAKKPSRRPSWETVTMNKPEGILPTGTGSTIKAPIFGLL
jgi:hypothetical protein